MTILTSVPPAAKALTAKAPSLALLIVLIAFPQLSQTIYAPALPDIARVFAVSAASVQLTMSLYFIGFALGVLCWGRLADRWGRRPAMLTGLACYCLGAVGALLAPGFAALLAARAMLAFGASAGSVVVQTIFRDAFQGVQLAAAFSTVSAMLSFSPAVGPLLGSLLVCWHGYLAVFTALCLLGLGLWLASVCLLEETRPAQMSPAPPWLQLGRRLLTDRAVMSHAALVAGFNLMLFAYYSLAPFTLARLGMPSWVFGASGLVVAVGSALGAWLNRRWLKKYSVEQLIRRSVSISVVAAMLQLVALVFGLNQAWWAVAGLLITQLALVAAYGSAIPNVLSTALAAYRDVQGTAGAIFGLTYYLLIGAGLWVVSALYQPALWFQPTVMLAVSVAMWAAVPRRG